MTAGSPTDRPIYRGVFAAPVTPFTDAGAVDLDALGRLTDFLVRQGVDGVALPLHTGESLNLTTDERKALLEGALTVVDGRVPVMAHVSMPGTDQVVDLARHAQEVGAAAVVAVTPYHWRPSPAELLAHFGAVAAAVSIDVLVYNFPARLGVSITAGLLEELIARCPNLVGVKDASYVMPSMVVGGAGCFSPASSIAPRLIRELFDACAEGDLVRARPLQYRASALWHLLRDTGYPASVKAALTLFGRPAGGVRLPLLDLDADALARLTAGLDALGLRETEPHGW